MSSGLVADLMNEIVSTTFPKVPKMRAAQVSRPGGAFEIVERDIPQPDAGRVRIKIQACGICHSDVMVKEGLWPGLQYRACQAMK